MFELLLGENLWILLFFVKNVILNDKIMLIEVAVVIGVRVVGEPQFAVVFIELYFFPEG